MWIVINEDYVVNGNTLTKIYCTKKHYTGSAYKVYADVVNTQETIYFYGFEHEECAKELIKKLTAYLTGKNNEYPFELKFISERIIENYAKKENNT